MNATHGTRNHHRIAVGDEFLFCGPVARWSNGIPAKLVKTADGYDVVARDGGRLAFFGTAAKFWAAPLAATA